VNQNRLRKPYSGQAMLTCEKWADFTSKGQPVMILLGYKPVAKSGASTLVKFVGFGFGFALVINFQTPVILTRANLPPDFNYLKPKQTQTNEKNKSYQKIALMNGSFLLSSMYGVMFFKCWHFRPSMLLVPPRTYMNLLMIASNAIPWSLFMWGM